MTNSLFLRSGYYSRLGKIPFFRSRNILQPKVYRSSENSCATCAEAGRPE
jgi:hypothetical protein